MNCKKQITVAVIIKDDKVLGVGSNEIYASIDKCPREGMKSGEGYDLCKSVCKQANHAEVAACLNVGLARTKGATLYLHGHTYVCDDCQKVMDRYGIARTVIIKP